MSKALYWIGAYDKHDNTVFYWPNGHKVYYTNWGGGDEVAHNKQPDDSHSHPQNCVLLYGPDYYRWHDDQCKHTQHFICEDSSTLTANIVHHTGYFTYFTVFYKCVIYLFLKSNLDFNE